MPNHTWFHLAVMTAALAGSLASATAATYYVDYSAGSDSNDGLTTGTAWQHSPGDANATGTPAATVLQPGDVVSFKGGVVYNGNISFSANASHGNTGQGTSNNPIVMQSADAWGTGRAILDGTIDGTNGVGSAFLLGYYGGRNYLTINGFDIRNYAYGGVQVLAGSFLVVSNNVIHHIGYFPYNISNDGGAGFGLYMRYCGNIICVSNTMYDLNETAFYPYAPVTNVICWGNTFSNVQDHAIIGGASGYSVIACNAIHDQTNGVTHDDGIHYQYWGEGSNCLVVANNFLYNNNQDIFLNTGASGFERCGTAYIFNNILMNTTSGDGLGDYGNYNGIVINVQENPWDNTYIFNNDILLKNAGSAGLNIAARGVNPVTGLSYASTNLYCFNNLLFQSFFKSTAPQTYLLNTYVGYNCQTNALRGNLLGTNEANDVYGAVSFANLLPSNLPASDFHLSPGSTGIGQGTNLTAMIPANTFNFLPAPYQIDPTKDAAGAGRGAQWDIGAFQHSDALGTADPPDPPSGLIVIGQ